MPSIPTSEARLTVTRGTTATWFSTVTAWPFMVRKISVLFDGEDVTLVNRQIAGSGNAEVPYPPIPAPSRRPVPVLVSGEFTPDGTPVAGLSARIAQLDANLAHLTSNVVGRVATGDGTVNVELFGLDGVTKGVKPAQFAGPLRTVDDSPITALVTLDFYFPKGVFSL